jgi:nucleoside-diphosphate-sugar epimerase
VLASCPMSKRVAVTGAAGYIGSHVVGLLVRQGYQVRAVVHSALSAVEHLTALGAEVVQGDVLEPGGWSALLEGCDALVHCAAAVRFHAKDAERDIVAVALEGTRNVLHAAVKATRVRQVVHLSSIAAVLSYNRLPGYHFSSKDWCEDATLKKNPYGLAKTRSEQLAWELVKARASAEPPLRLLCINPGYVLGPVLSASHAKTSPGIVRDILRADTPGSPPLNFNVVDVRDVAEACLRALEADALSRRVILVAGRLWWEEVARLCKQEFPERRIHTRPLPKLLLYGVGLVDPRVSLAFLRANLGRELLVDDEGRATLGLEYRPLSETIRDTARSLEQLGALGAISR